MRRSIVVMLLVLGMTSATTSTAGEVNLAPVTVLVRTSADAPVADAYVAFVPAWRPSSNPLVEEVAKEGKSVLHVPAGVYELIVAAHGFAVSWKGPVEIREGGRDLVVKLTPLTSINGSVKDGTGAPIEGARISTLNAAVPPPLSKLSVLLAQYLVSDSMTTTSAAGTWTMQVPDGAVPLLFEKTGRAPELRVRNSNDSGPVDVSLASGSRLKVDVDRQDANLVVFVLQEGQPFTTSIPLDKERLVWARVAHSKELLWDSLPPGVYGIYAKYPAPLYFMEAPSRLTTVTLSAGEAHEVSVHLPAVRQLSTRTVALFLQGIGSEDLGEKLESFGQEPDGRTTRLDSILEDVVGGTVIHLKSEGAHPPFRALTENQFVSAVPPLAGLQSDASAEPADGAVHKRTNANLQFLFAEKGLQPPRSGIAQLRACEGGGDVTVPIEIQNTGFARFIGAAGCQSLVLSVEPFEPVVIQKFLSPGDQSLGEFTLRGAASADVRVIRDPGSALVAGATVRVTATDDLLPSPPMVLAEAVTDERGLAHLHGLSSYRELGVIAKTPAGETSGAAVLRLKPAERGIVDLTIPEAAELIVDAKIDEAFLANFPSAQVVSLAVSPVDPKRQTEQLQLVPQDGLARFKAIHAGAWRVFGVLRVEKTYTPFDLKDVELKAGESKRVNETIAPNAFDGIVTSEGVGIAAKVMIATGGKMLYFISNDSGKLRVVLQEKGVYRVSAARLSAQSNMMPVGDVAFTDVSQRVEIALPKVASVTVRAREGDKPLSQALVWLSRRDGDGLVDRGTNRARTTDGAGETKFEDLSPGLWTFSIKESMSHTGVEKTVSIESGADQVIDLDMAGAGTIEGSIHDRGGALLPRARIECLYVGPSGNPDRASSLSDANGRFSVDLIAPPPPAALCSVVGPFGTADAIRAIPGRQLDLTVPVATATLSIANWTGADNPDALWLVAPDGRAISLRAAAASSTQVGSALTIPAIAAGQWTLVRAQSLGQWISLATGMGASLPALAEISLEPGAAKTMKIVSIPAP